MNKIVPLKIASRTLNLKTQASKVECLTFRLKTPNSLHKANLRKMRAFIESEAAGCRKKDVSSIVIPDKTRPLPAKGLVKSAVEILARRGFQKISIIIALGNHKKHPLKYLSLPKNILNKVNIVHHDSTDRTELIKICGQKTRSRIAFKKYLESKTEREGFLGEEEFEDIRKEFLSRSKKGIYVNRAFAQSDLRVIISEIKPHQIFGYSGGPKMILPGIADRNSIITNHLMRLHPKSRLGNSKGNLPRLESHEIADRLKVLYITVLGGEKGRIEGLSTYTKSNAYYKTASQADRVFKVRSDRFSTVVSVGLPPVNINLYQLTKVITPAARALKKHGKIIVAAKVKEKACDLETMNKRIYGLTIRRELPSHSEKIFLYSNLPKELVKKTFLIPIDRNTFYKMVEEEKESILFIADGDLTVPC